MFAVLISSPNKNPGLDNCAHPSTTQASRLRLWELLCFHTNIPKVVTIGRFPAFLFFMLVVKKEKSLQTTGCTFKRSSQKCSQLMHMSLYNMYPAPIAI